MKPEALCLTCGATISRDQAGKLFVTHATKSGWGVIPIDGSELPAACPACGKSAVARVPVAEAAS